MTLGVIAIGIVLVFAKEAFALHGTARRKMIVAFLLMVEAIVFFVLYIADANLAELLRHP